MTETYSRFPRIIYIFHVERHKLREYKMNIFNMYICTYVRIFLL